MSMAVPSLVRRWLVPASAALAVVGGGVAIGLVTAAADNPSVQPRSAEQLLTDMLTARPDGLQGSVAVRTDLGLPPLPLPTPGSADLTSLATGTHTMRVWYAGPDHARVALLGREGETDVITNGTDLWVWSSHENKALHTTVPSGGSLASVLGGGLLAGGAGLPSAGPAPSVLPSGFGMGQSVIDPSALASMALRFLEPSTQISTDTSASVAGRSAYELVLRPRDTASLIDSIVVDIDAVEHFPLRFAVLARDGGAPAVEIAFTEVSFDRPDDSQFTFNPPPGAEVVDELDPAAEPSSGGAHGMTWDGNAPSFAVVGTGWTTVLAVEVPDDEPDGDLAKLLADLPQVSGDWGSGKLLSTRLFSALLTDDGRMLAGAVAPDRLYEASTDPAADLGR